MSSAEIPRQLGDYHLARLVGEEGDFLVFDAEQVSVGREVTLILLHPGISDDASVAAFAKVVKAKASVHHVNIAPVFEVIHLDDYHFFTRQKLSGQTLAELAAAKTKLVPLDIFKILKTVADARQYLQEKEIACLPLEGSQIHFHPTSGCGLKNTATTEARAEDPMAGDMAVLADVMQPLLDLEGPGAGRAHTILRWMRGEDRKAPLSWNDLKHLCEQVESQFTTETYEQIPSRRVAGKKPEKSFPLPVIVVGILVIAGVTAALLINGKKPEPADVDQPVAPTTLLIQVDEATPFELAPGPVTIADYARFLEALADMSDSEKARLVHTEQPPEKTSYQPEGWADMEDAAALNIEWNGRTLSFESPVTNVDFWDAHAYATWAGGALPGEKHWELTLRFCKENNRSLPRHEDISEWTTTLRRNPSFPMGPKYPRLLLPKGSKSIFSPGESRNQRSPQLGFRPIFPARQTES